MAQVFQGIERLMYGLRGFVLLVNVGITQLNGRKGTARLQFSWHESEVYRCPHVVQFANVQGMITG